MSRHCHYDVIRDPATARPVPATYYDVILVTMTMAPRPPLWTYVRTNEWTYGHLTAFNIWKYRQTLWTCAQTSLTTPLRSEHYAMLMLRQDAKTNHERVHDQTANRRQPPSPARSSRLHSLFKSWMECCILPSLRSLNYRLPRHPPQTQVRRHPRVIT